MLKYSAPARALFRAARRSAAVRSVSNTYDEVFRRSIDTPGEFWAEAAESLVWAEKWHKALDASDPLLPKWFVGGKLNTTYNCIDRHVEQGRGQQVAIIHDSPVTNSKEKITYAQLLDTVSRLARVLVNNGIRKGDRVIIYMPMIPQAIYTMLACARIGAVHSVVFGGFAAKELAVRINHAKPKLIVTTNCGVEPGRIIDYKKITDEAIKIADNKPQHCLVYQRPTLPRCALIPQRDLDFQDQLNNATKPHDAVPIDANDPLYILYTSGTTGAPKGMVRPNGGHAVALSWTFKNIYDMHPNSNEKWWTASDLGWVVGHSYICYAPLLSGVTTVLFEGKPVGTPDPSTFFRIIDEYQCSALFTAPTALRAIRKDDPTAEHAKRYEMRSLRNVFVAGEHCDAETQQWGEKVFGRPVLDHYWQTETGWAMTATCAGLGMPTRNLPLSTAGKPVPGYDVRVIHDDQTPCKPGEFGFIVIRLPMPPGMTAGFLDNVDLYKRTYFQWKGYYDTQDAGHATEDGYISVLSRSDDIINVAGHRLSTSALEEALDSVDGVADSAVVGVADSLKGQIPLGFIIPRDNKISAEALIKKCVNAVRTQIGAVAFMKRIVVVSKLPKTRSGKVARGTLSKMADGKAFTVPSTIEDATVYDEIGDRLREAGFKPSRPVG